MKEVEIMDIKSLKNYRKKVKILLRKKMFEEAVITVANLSLFFTQKEIEEVKPTITTLKYEDYIHFNVLLNVFADLNVFISGGFPLNSIPISFEINLDEFSEEEFFKKLDNSINKFLNGL